MPICVDPFFPYFFWKVIRASFTHGNIFTVVNVGLDSKISPKLSLWISSDGLRWRNLSKQRAVQTLIPVLYRAPVFFGYCGTTEVKQKASTLNRLTSPPSVGEVCSPQLLLNWGNKRSLLRNSEIILLVNVVTGAKQRRKRTATAAVHFATFRSVIRGKKKREKEPA